MLWSGSLVGVFFQELPAAVKEAQQKRLEELKQQSDSHVRAELERKMALRYRRVKFFGKFAVVCRLQHLRNLVVIGVYLKDSRLCEFMNCT